MTSSKAAEFVKEGISKGLTPEELKQALSETQEQKPSKYSYNINLNQYSASQILLFIGALITIIGGILYITINWSQWNSIFRVLAIFFPTAILFLIGISLYLKKEKENLSMAFLVTGSLLFPLFLSVFVNEFHLLIGDQQFYLRGLVISALTLLLYVLESFIFPNPAWTFLYTTVGVFLEFFIIQYYKIDIIPKFTLHWALLLLSWFYFGLGFIYERINQKEFSRYPILIAAGVAIFSIIGLLFGHQLEDVATWYLLIPIMIFFVIGYIFESEKKLDYASIAFFLSTSTLFLTFSKLALGNRILNIGINFSQGLDQYATLGLSFIIISLIYFSLAYLFRKRILFNSEVLTKFTGFFELIGSVSFLGGSFYTSLGGKKFLQEFLTLLASLGFIFGSIPIKSKYFLYAGTIFLVIYIFDIGSEYFQNQVGWPITLFTAGILSMMVGFAAEKIKNKLS